MERSTTWRPPGFGWSRRAVTSTATVTSADRGVVIDATNNTFAANLPTAASAGSGFLVAFYDSGAGIFTITANGAETIQTTAGTATTLALTTGMGAVLQSTGTAWEVLSGAGNAANGMSLTSGRIPYATTQGRLIDSANLTFNGTNFAHGGSGTFATGTGGVALNSTVTVASTAALTSTQTTVTTNALVATQTWKLRSSGTPAAGLGHNLNFQCSSDTVNDRAQFEIDTAWVVATDASRTSYTRFFQYDTAAREVFRTEASGSAAMIGFLGASAVVRPTSTTDLRQALINLGLYTTGGATPLNLNGGAFQAAAGSFSGVLTVSGNEERITGTSPQLWLNETDATADSGKWLWSAASDVLKLRILNDAEGVVSDVLSFTRTGTTVGTITIGGATTQATNWAQTGATTISTGTGQASLNGNVVVASGKTITAVSGIIFSNETLSTYDEGTWTPTISGGTTPGTNTYTAQVGWYVKIGKTVTAGFRIDMSVKDGAMAGTLRLSGLPFTTNATSNYKAGGNIFYDTNIAFTNQLAFGAGDNVTFAEFYDLGKTTATAAAALTAASVANGLVLMGSITYMST